MNYFGPISNWRGKYSEVPTICIGRDPDFMTYLTALAFPLIAAIVPYRSVELDKLETKYGIKIFAISDYIEKRYLFVRGVQFSSLPIIFPSLYLSLYFGLTRKGFNNSG